MTIGRRRNERLDLLQGTLDMLIMRTLILGQRHGHSIGQAIQQMSEKVLVVETGSLYPALQRLEKRGWIESEWGTSDNNRKAKYYRLTAAGRRQLRSETTTWERLTHAVSRILALTQEESKS